MGSAGKGDTMHALRLVCLAVLVGLVAAMTSAGAQETGIAVKRPVFGAACKICPWGAVAEFVKEALRPYGYEVLICSTCARADAPRIVADARMSPPVEQGSPIPLSQRYIPTPNGPIEFGATSLQNLWDAYRGVRAYAAEAPRTNLRLLATVQQPNYLIVAVKAELGITDLGQIEDKRWPVRILMDRRAETVLTYYGLTRESIEAAGGRILESGLAFGSEGRRNFDVIIHGGTLGNAPEWNVWYEVSQIYDLHYLQLPDDLLAELGETLDMERGTIPNGLLRGIDRPIPTVVRTGHAVYGRDDMSEDFAYTVAKALDEQQHLLQWSHLPFSYNLRTVWKAFGVPLHPGAERYYREQGFIDGEETR